MILSEAEGSKKDENMFIIKKNNIFYRKAQVTIFFIGMIASLIALAFVVIMVGKTAKDKTYSANAADAGALAACSVMAQAFNENSYHNARQEQEQKMTEAEGLDPKAAGQRLAQGIGREADVLHQGMANPHAMPGSHNADTLPTTEKSAKLVEEQRRNVDFGYDDGQEEDAQARDSMQEYEDNAVATGYQVCFHNSGIQHRLGRLTGKLYEQFFKTLQPKMVRSGEPKTFAWVDGAARFHMVTCIVQLEPTNNWVNRTSAMDYPTQQQQRSQGQAEYQSSNTNDTTGRANSLAAIPPWPYLPGPILHALSKVFGRIGNGFFRSGYRSSATAHQGHKRETSKLSSSAADNTNDYIKHRDDIVHSRMVYVANFQFHMGSPIKSTWGDIDEMTFYPPVQSSAIASFNYTGMGNIHRRGASGSDPRHECGLIGAF